MILGGVLFLPQIFKDQRRRGKAPTRWILFILLSVSAYQIEEDLAPQALPNSSCDDIWFVPTSPLE
jgi:hypothetical protein